MDIKSTIEETIQELLSKLSLSCTKITIKEDSENGSYRVNIDSEDPSMLIGYHGENIHSFQHILKAILWKKVGKSDFNVIVDVDEYRKRQEDNVINLTERKVEIARNTNTDQKLPPMAPYFRRLVHLHITKPEFDDIETESVGEDDRRQVIVRVK